jgi:hypothetical protein
MGTSSGTAPAPVIIEHDGVLIVRDDLFRGGTKARFISMIFNGADEVAYASPAEGARAALAVVLPTSFMGVCWSVLAVEFPPAAVEALECAIEIGHTPNPVSNAIEATLQSAPWVDETKQCSR